MQREHHNTPVMLKAAEKIAFDVREQWDKCGRNSLVFADIASAVLLRHEPHRSFVHNEFLEWVLSAVKLPRQFDLTASFGQPPITIYNDEDFIIDIYFWVTPDTVIHDHGFSGAFTNLLGRSLQCRYTFKHAASPCAEMRIGTLSLFDTEYLQPGSVTAIYAGSQFIHRVWHVSRPTVSLVVRLRSQTESFEQWRYAAPGLAIRKSATLPPEFQRMQQFLSYLSAIDIDDAYAMLVMCVTRAGAWHACLLIQQFYVRQRSNSNQSQFWQRLDDLVDIVHTQHGSWAQVLKSVFRNYDKEACIEWGQLVDEQMRLLVALQLTNS